MTFFLNHKYLKTIFLICFVVIVQSTFSQEVELLIRADDMGALHSFNKASIESYENGIVRSVEVMVPGPWFNEAVELLKQHPSLDVGVHITLTSEWSGVKWRPLTTCPSITDELGNFYPNVLKNEHQPNSSIAEVEWNIEEIEQEVRAQIETALRLIPQISHISDHMGCLNLSEETRALKMRLEKEYELELSQKFKLFPGWLSGNNIKEKEADFIKKINSLSPGRYMFLEHPASIQLSQSGEN